MRDNGDANTRICTRVAHKHRKFRGYGYRNSIKAVVAKCAQCVATSHLLHTTPGPRFGERFRAARFNSICCLFLDFCGEHARLRTPIASELYNGSERSPSRFFVGYLRDSVCVDVAGNRYVFERRAEARKNVGGPLMRLIRRRVQHLHSRRTFSSALATFNIFRAPFNS